MKQEKIRGPITPEIESDNRDEPACKGHVGRSDGDVFVYLTYN